MIPCKNQRVTLFQCYFHINKGHDHIVLVDNGKTNDGHRKVTKDICLLDQRYMFLKKPKNPQNTPHPPISLWLWGLGFKS